MNNSPAAALAPSSPRWRSPSPRSPPARGRPDVAAITLPGMPSGTPGMPGPKSGPLQIFAISKTGAAPTVYDVQ